MRRISRVVRVVTVVAALIALLSVEQVKGEGANQSFGATNQLLSGASLTTYPTNTTGTNLTGGAINVANYDRAGFYWAGYVTVAGTATVTLVRSPYSFSPTVSALSNNFETTASKTLSIEMPNTGPFTYLTNLEPEYVRPANWIGMNRMTNAAGTITNLDSGLTKHLIPLGTR